MKFRTIFFIGLIAIGGYFAYKHFAGGGAAQGGLGAMGMMGGPPVNVAAAVSREVRMWSEFSGRLQAVDQAEVRPRVSGAITKVHFTDGSMVKAGDSLFTIDPRPYEAELQRAQGMLASAQ